ncbi:glycogen debranching enzyme GlgX, partial [Halomonas sp. BBD48]|nr:glycogen debranching enzyme GlgX [Halomonas sp. BBD48]
DEMLRTQEGNNNAYCQDNEISWLDWNLSGDAHAMIDYVRHIIALRHRYPILRRGRFLSGDYNEDLGLKEVTWLTPDGDEMDVERWEDPETRSLGVLLDGRARPSGIRRPGADVTLLLLLNAHPEAVAFQLPEVPRGSGWMCRLNTAMSLEETECRRAFGDEHRLLGQSLALLELVQDNASS